MFRQWFYQFFCVLLGYLNLSHSGLHPRDDQAIAEFPMPHILWRRDQILRWSRGQFRNASSQIFLNQKIIFFFVICFTSRYVDNVRAKVWIHSLERYKQVYLSIFSLYSKGIDKWAQEVHRYSSNKNKMHWGDDIENIFERREAAVLQLNRKRFPNQAKIISRTKGVVGPAMYMLIKVTS